MKELREKLVTILCDFRNEDFGSEIDYIKKTDEKVSEIISITQLQNNSNWINVEDEEPKEDNLYLVVGNVLRPGKIETQYAVCMYRFHFGHDMKRFETHIKVTHFMPLNKPL